MRKIPELPPVICDTREREFAYTSEEFGGLATQRGTLETGDYSLLGCERRVTVERKTREDAYKSVGVHRDRFEREWLRMSEMTFAAVVVEGSIPKHARNSLLVPPEHSQMNPKAVVRTYIAWSVRYRVPVYFAGDRSHGAALTRALLEFWWSNLWFTIEKVTQEQWEKMEEGQQCQSA